MLLLQAVRVGTAALVRHCPRGLLALSTPFFAYHACPVMVLLVITAVRVYLEVRAEGKCMRVEAALVVEV
eukprot:m.85592 g.85592  ORF g.85592 m.85592 type:complete len:70 (+) comp15059_c0_seq2:965-1174(+)